MFRLLDYHGETIRLICTYCNRIIEVTMVESFDENDAESCRLFVALVDRFLDAANQAHNH